jgi:aspartyl-tRNA synthetase
VAVYSAAGLRTHHAAELAAASLDQRVTLAGWVNRRRDHGGVVFIDLRDASGLVQIVADPNRFPELDGVRAEYCLRITGTLRRRPPGSENDELATGAVEVAAETLEILSEAEVLPFVLTDRAEVEERIRLQYRYLDLRRPRMAANLVARSRVVRALRQVLDQAGFLEVETPTLIVSTPEGARDLLVPSRLRPGTFYALPQSPQLFKQLLMIAGVERYYQIARCYRDEDFRSDRQIEFTQLDLEGAFWGQSDVLATLERLVVAAVKDLRGVDLRTPFPRLTYADAVARFGTDKPDLRFGMEIADVSAIFEATGFKGFAAVLEGGGVVRGINVGGQESTRSKLDALTERATSLGAKGLVSLVVEPGGQLKGAVAKFLTATETADLAARLDGRPGDLLLLVADRVKVVASVLGQMRLDLGRPARHDELVPLFVVDFPVFEVADDGTLAPAHHPFTAPVDVEEMRANPAGAVSQAYDLVLNGVELGSGSVRIHNPKVQAQVFEVLGIDEQASQRRFGWFLEALRYGTPPHAGFAIGLDRFVSIIQNEPNIREVMPFPKTQTGADPLTGSPAPVEQIQLDELGIRLAIDPTDNLDP